MVVTGEEITTGIEEERETALLIRKKIESFRWRKEKIAMAREEEKSENRLLVGMNPAESLRKKEKGNVLATKRTMTGNLRREKVRRDVGNTT